MNSSQMITQLEMLDVAGKMLEQQENKDLMAPGLLELTGITQHGMPTASGLNDYDYQSLDILSLGHKQLNQIQTVNKIPIPPEILEHFKHVKCCCMMGLFPEIGRAWLTIDAEIYIWTYEQSRDVAYYDGLNQLIFCVGLVTPRVGVFIKDVKYLLILATPLEIVVLGVIFGDTTTTISSPYEEMQLINKPIYIISADSVKINVIKGTDNGRIFYGGSDGCLYEICYQAESNWLGRRCYKVNHSKSIISCMVPNFLKEIDVIVNIVIDNGRQILYVLTEKGSIEAWDMKGEPGTMHRVARLSTGDIALSAVKILKTIDQAVFKSIKSICPILEEDCKHMHLLAVTQCGVRLYFSTTPLDPDNFYQQQQQSRAQQIVSPPTTTGASTTGPGTITKSSSCSTIRPSSLYLYHVRLPPGYTPNTTVNKPKQVHSAYYSHGTLLLVSMPQADQNILWSISSAPFPKHPYLVESTTVLPLDGNVWSMGEMRDRTSAKFQSIVREAHMARKVIMLTNQGAHIVALLKPADILKQLLIACQGPHHEAVKNFFKILSEREACFTSLLIACCEHYRGTDLAMWASQAFMLYGGEPGLPGNPTAAANITSPQPVNIAAAPPAAFGRNLVSSPTNMSGTMGRNSPHMFMSTPVANENSPRHRPMQNTLPHLSQTPLSPIGLRSSHGSIHGQAVPSLNDTLDVLHSAKHDGLYMFVSRLVRPIWKKPCVLNNMNSAFTSDDCSLILEDLYAIRAFLDNNPVNELSCTVRPYNNQSTLSNGFHGIGQNMHLSTTTNNEQRNDNEQAQLEEKRSLSALISFIKHACEVIGLWKILCEHQFPVLVGKLPKEQQSSLLCCTFRDLILLRSETCTLFIVALITSYLEDNANVSSISARLRDICPNLYRHEDAVSFKAAEILLSSKHCTNEDERNEMLRTALQLCKDAAPNLPLESICQQFTMAGFYEGVIELASTCATKYDPDEFGIHFYNNDQPSEDCEGLNAYSERMTCYKEVRLMLDHVYRNICNDNTTPDVSRHGCPKPAQYEEVDTIARIMNIILLALQMKDPLLHVAIYEWLLSHDLLSELLSVAEASLGEFLRRIVVRHPDNLKLIDLLWKYYEKNGQHSQAAKVLDNLATNPSNAVPLLQRIEYLARAVMCMRNDSVGYSIANGLLLKELEDKLEIARVQKAVYDDMCTLATTSVSAAKAMDELNSTLYDITQLYQNFADPFELWECKLTILNCSHHNDPLLIQAVWDEIIAKALDGGKSTQEKCTCLFSKIETLVKRFGESGHCFPLSHLIRALEVKACQHRFVEGIVPEKLVAMNLDIDMLMEYYSRMILLNERVWANEGNEWHLVQSSIRIVSLLVDNSHKMWYRTKRRIVGKAQDIVSACLNLCYQKPDTDLLQQSLKELQFRLQRILP